MRELERHFNNMYDKFKLMLYDRALKERGSSTPGDLSLQEVIYMEIIIALGSPTVAEFSRYSKLSAPNTAYRLNKLEEKGYIKRIRNDLDKREFRIEATNRYREEYGVIFDYIHLVCDRIEERFSPEDVDKFREMLGIISDELMPEAGSQLSERSAKTL
ncbi:MAG: MarR family transcriptional regulator [Mogibacterium sp.]|nr:MarR family transcriptional regulator [Mogibacterium sp.]MBQ6499782.1 MarR family transcriptional regulator [Mogibacterium sp.]